MSPKNDQSMSDQSDSDNTATENDLGGKLHLNKQTLQDLNPADEHAEKVRGGVLATVVCGKGRCSEKESGCN